MLTRDRPEMAARAVRSFREQTHPNKCLVRAEPIGQHVRGLVTEPGDQSVGYRDEPRRSIGWIRNEAAFYADKDSILIHFDDDDWAHRSRIAEQVECLQSSGADAVGYSQTLFWDTTKEPEAWIYCGAPIGASLCYW